MGQHERVETSIISERCPAVPSEHQQICFNSSFLHQLTKVYLCVVCICASWVFFATQAAAPEKKINYIYVPCNHWHRNRFGNHPQLQVHWLDQTPKRDPHDNPLPKCPSRWFRLPLPVRQGSKEAKRSWVHSVMPTTLHPSKTPAPLSTASVLYDGMFALSKHPKYQDWSMTIPSYFCFQNPFHIPILIYPHVDSADFPLPFLPVTKVDIPQVLNWILDWEGHESLVSSQASTESNPWHVSKKEPLEQSQRIR